MINGITGYSEYIIYRIDEFKWDKKSLYLKIGSSVFTEKYIDLDIQNDKLHVEGHLEYNNNITYPSKFFSPGIMGWYSFVPFMECKHGIVSVNHDITGSLTIGSNEIDFNQGKGFIEKDWGTSFPEAWLWIQANNFYDHTSSFSFSVAKIPWLGRFFIGFISFLYFNGRFFMFSTYNNSVISEIKQSPGTIDLILNNRNTRLEVKVIKNTFGELRAPVSGDMSRRIKESIDSEVTLRLFDKNDNLIYSDSSRRAGLECIDKIFEYFNNEK